MASLYCEHASSNLLFLYSKFPSSLCFSATKKSCSSDMPTGLVPLAAAAVQLRNRTQPSSRRNTQSSGLTNA
eukprot:763664-Hanusia_phi.AAC.7